MPVLTVTTVSEEKKNIHAWLTLYLTDGLGASGCRKLADHFGGVVKAVAAKPEEILATPGIPSRTLQQFIADRGKNCSEATRQTALADRNNIHLITIEDPRYPTLLANIYNPPVLLFAKGDITILNSCCIAMVGSRAATSYGKNIAADMAARLANNGFTIVSGMALGVDTEVHKAALGCGGKTIAVLGCGLDIVYPPGNKQLFDKIPQAGAVLSEYPFGTAPDGFRFPTRNRIISGLCLGVVVVEAAKRSGSLITAKHALDQNREVFAIPGRIDSVKSAGTHKLAQQGAKLVHCVEDILEELPITPAGEKGTFTNRFATTRSNTGQLSPEEEKLLSCMDAYPLPIDDLTVASGLSAQKINELLMLLELKGAVEALPGKLYRRA